MTTSTQHQKSRVSKKTYLFVYLFIFSFFPGKYANSQDTLHCTSTISSNFDGTKIPSGKYIWFNAHLSATGIVDGTTIYVDGQKITSSEFNLEVPSSRITFLSSATISSYVFSGGVWDITIPLSGSDEIFFGGYTYNSPGLPGGINPVNWTATFTASTPNVSLQWQWSAAVYNTFSSDYNSLNVLLIHDSQHAGTPQAYAYSGNVYGGARGGAGSNYTGSWSATEKVAPCTPSGGPLPLIVGDLQGSYSGGIAKLNWNTFNETGVGSFDVEHSTDGINFKFVQSYTAKGTSTGNKYLFEDKNVAPGLNYYRLKITATSNVTSYSNIIAMNIIVKGISINSIYPNPFVDQVKVVVVSENAQPVSIRLIDNSGRIINQNNTTVQKGLTEILLNNIQSLQSGLYILEVKTPFTVVRSKINK